MRLSVSVSPLMLFASGLTSGSDPSVLATRFYLRCSGDQTTAVMRDCSG